MAKKSYSHYLTEEEGMKKYVLGVILISVSQAKAQNFNCQSDEGVKLQIRELSENQSEVSLEGSGYEYKEEVEVMQGHSFWTYKLKSDLTAGKSLEVIQRFHCNRRVCDSNDVLTSAYFVLNDEKSFIFNCKL
jgi:hypothetical protein